MEEKKVTNGSNEVKRPAPPPVVPKKPAVEKGKNKKLIIFIPIIIAIIVAAVVVAVVLKKGDKNKQNTFETVVITDSNGVPVTGSNGEPITGVQVIVTDVNGEAVTDSKGKPVVIAPVIVTNESGEAVTDPKGKPVVGTPAIVTKPNGEPVTDEKGKPVTIAPIIVTDPSGENVTNSKGEPVVGTPVIVTDPSGETVTDAEGEPVTIAPVVVTDPSGENVTNSKGDPVIGIPVIVTNPSGETVTDSNGEPMTVVPVTKVEEYTDTNGNTHTTIVQDDVTVNIPVTDNKGETVTNKDGEDVTEQIVIKPPVNNDGSVIIGTTAVPVTDGAGNTAVDDEGNVHTTIVEITTTPTVVDSADIDWKSAQGGTAADYFSSVETLKDGSYITSVVTNSTDGDFAKYKELGYATPYTVLTKYSKSGEIVWQNALGTKRGITVIMDLVPTNDGGFYAVGYGKNVGGVNGKGYYDGAVFKFSKKGEQEWFQKFGTTTVDLFNGGTLTKDGGVVVAGSVGTNDGDAKGFNKPAYQSAAALVKYNADGTLAWKNIVGGDKDSFAGVVEGTDGNIYCVGNFYSGVLFKGLGSSDSGVSKFASNGEYIDTARIGGSGIESFKGITACKNGGVAIVGKSNSSDAGSTSSMFVSDLASRGGYDSYIIKLDSDLDVIFAKVFRGQNNDDLTCVVETEDGSFIAAGSSNSSTRDFKGVTTRGGEDIVIASFDKYGELSWARSFGGTDNESANAICLGTNGGYLVAGRSLSKDIDLKGIAKYNAGKSIGVIVKFPE